MYSICRTVCDTIEQKVKVDETYITYSTRLQASAM